MQEKFSQYTVKDQNPIVGHYRVPHELRKEKKDAYTPKAVSIGPIHHGEKQLQVVERSKWILLDWYLRRPSALSFNETVRVGISIEEEARMYYEERFDNISSQEFSEMIILDFIFLIEFLFKNDSYDFPFHNCIYLDILSDMMLLENQLPKKLVTSLFEKLYKGYDNLGEIILKHFRRAYDIAEFPKAHPNDWNSATDMLDFMVKCNGNQTKETNETSLEKSRSATELQEAGVMFSKKEKADFLLDVNFVSGILEMPILKLDCMTEILFRNMIACEQTSRDSPKRVGGYIVLLSYLIKSTKDVIMLSDCGIIQHPDHNEYKVRRLFETVAKGVAHAPKNCYFRGLYVEMHKYSEKKRNKWKGSWFKWKCMLRKKYFSSPWSIISFIAAFILLVLTAIQTAYAIKQK